MDRTVRLLFWAGLTLAAYGCAGSGVYRPDGNAILAEGKSRNVPLFIYHTSWNSQRFDGGKMMVGLVSFDDRPIESILLSVSPCGNKGEVLAPKSLVIGGPFKRGLIYATFPAWPFNYADTWHVPDPAEYSTTTDHLMIKAVTIEYEDGTREVHDKDVAQLLDKSISNFCSNSPGEDNLPPSVTVGRN
jgi:hypothetical protein